MNTHNDAADLSLYKRLGGYDVIAAIIEDLFALMRADAKFACFGLGRGIDSRKRAQQLTVDQICSLAGGPCYYMGRDMKNSHAGLKIPKPNGRQIWNLPGKPFSAMASTVESRRSFCRYSRALRTR
jgi:hypothetical protein